jgi:hypothetical protein
MHQLFYMRLESYQARFILQLTEWNRRVFERRKVNKTAKDMWLIDPSRSR